MAVYNEFMNINLSKKKWKLSGTSEVQSLRNSKCDGCGETKLCEFEYVKAGIEGASDYIWMWCEDCKKNRTIKLS